MKFRHFFRSWSLIKESVEFERSECDRQGGENKALSYI